MSDEPHGDPSRLARLNTREEPHVEADEAAAMPLLLHSVGLFREVLGDLAAVVRPTGIAEIGGEGGLLTQELIAQAEALDASVTCIDPAPSAVLEGLAGTTRLELVRAYSPDAITELPDCQFVVVDGDHSYAVVRAETERLLERATAAGEHALLVFHDVCFPCGRRDYYYGPDGLDPADVHPHAFDTGMSVFGHDPVVGRGMRSRGTMGIADHAGGERNGVLTAVEDAIVDRDDLHLRVIPAIFGLGFVYSRDAPWAAEADRILEPLDRSPLIARLERNRLALYAKVLELQDELATQALDRDRERAVWEARLARASGADLAARLAALDGGGR
ncbi:class I SAM-dependent methyltransferase [Patulibacter sp.]|uniref:class I SAM-dependent methyltransferase n=1 Tax=Patulibacter sp. TaxID=1912859 RepID=UPI00271B1A95|nr:class I SAM-dependent methyltransferase [Patulibacter sp.]MDO9408787.1 class I SAM-dependent methyltransferase [Patulibacter sp.]